jgi:hypothetical protein
MVSLTNVSKGVFEANAAIVTEIPRLVEFQGSVQTLFPPWGTDLPTYRLPEATVCDGGDYWGQ